MLNQKPKYNFPESGLRPARDMHVYRSFNGLTGRANVENLVIDVPADAIPTSSAAYLYNLGNSTILCLTEVESLKSDQDAAADVLHCFDTSVIRTKIISTDEGYLNGFKWLYLCASAGDYSVTAYRTPVSGSHDLVIASIVKNPTDELIRQGVTIQQGVIGTISDPTPEAEKENDVVEDTAEEDVGAEGSDEFYELYDREASPWRNVEYTQQYNKYVIAEDNYEHMRLTVNWTDTHVVPRQLILYDRYKELEYSPVEMEEGKYVFIVDNVGYGEEFVVYFDMPNPGAIAFQQEEEADYEEYYDRPEEDYADFFNVPTDEASEEGEK